MENIIIDGNNLTIEKIWKVAHKLAKVIIAEETIERIEKARNFVVQANKDGKIIYGLTTGFGGFKDQRISPEKTRELSRNIILSHSVSVGEPFGEEVVRAAILVRVNSLIKGYSGIQLTTAQMFIDLLNNDIYPYVPQQGSVGSSGDLAPLCHIAAVMIGEGEAFINGKRTPGVRTLKEKGLKPIVLEAKEGLAVSNGTSVHTGQAALNIYKAERILKNADIAVALSLEALTGGMHPFFHKIHEIRPHLGQKESAENVRHLCQESGLVDKKIYYHRVQDSYSLRCAPQVHGASRDAFRYAKSVVDIEINSATDNPLIFVEDDIALSGGNFHGEPIGMSMNTLGIATAELGNISERRIAKLVDKAHNYGLPAFLTLPESGGLNSGLMIPQYTAAALVSENKILAHPSTVDSIPTSANQEDHVSMASIASRNAEKIIENSRRVLAIEFLSAAQGLEFRENKKLGLGTRVVYETIRSVSPPINEDREFYKDIDAIDKLLISDKIIEVVEKKIGKLI